MAIFSRSESTGIDLDAIRPTSKVALRLSCLRACGNDIQRAGELYGFIAEGLDLPDTDPKAPTRLEQIKAQAGEVMGWIGEHREDISQGIQFVRGLTSAAKATAPAAPPTGVPPIPGL